MEGKKRLERREEKRKNDDGTGMSRLELAVKHIT